MKLLLEQLQPPARMVVLTAVGKLSATSKPWRADWKAPGNTGAKRSHHLKHRIMNIQQYKMYLHDWQIWCNYHGLECLLKVHTFCGSHGIKHVNKGEGIDCPHTWVLLKTSINLLKNLSSMEIDQFGFGNG